MDYIPYARQLIDENDINQIVEVLKSPWLTTGPAVTTFEKKLADFCKAKHSVAVSSGTAALHLALSALSIGPEDEVILPAITFVATANAVLFTGAKPVFADILPHNLLIDPEDVKRAITPRTKAIIAVDYGGQPCDYKELSEIARENNLFLIADACHSLGATYHGVQVGTLADITVFSFHPVKLITTGEGGAATTNNEIWAKKIKMLRNHGINMDARERVEKNTWDYDMELLGYNYRITDIQCALGISQLSKLKGWIKKRNQLAAAYRTNLKKFDLLRPLDIDPGKKSAYHLFVVKLPDSKARNDFFHAMRAQKIGVNVHYKPVYKHSFYQRLGYDKISCRNAERAYDRIISLPMFPALTEGHIERITQAAEKALLEIGLG